MGWSVSAVFGVLTMAGCTSPVFTADMTGGAGNYRHDTNGDGGSSTGSTDAIYARLRSELVGEEGFGAGFAIEASGSDDDLFGNQVGSDSAGSMADAFLHLTVAPVKSDRFFVPIRIGPYARNTRIEFDDVDDEVNWNGYGGRLEVEPEFWFASSESFALGVVADASAGYHRTWTDAELDSVGLSEDFDGHGTSVGAGVGLQALFGRHMSMRIGYAYRANREAESDPENGIVIRSADSYFSGAVFQLGVRF